MKHRIQFAGLLLTLALAVPAFAQRSTSSQSMAPPASLLTGGQHLPVASPSITSRGFGRIDHAGHFGSGGHFAGPVRGNNGVPLRSFVPRRDHDGDRRDHNRRVYPIYYGGYYYPYTYGYGMPVYEEDYSSLPGAGTFDNGQGYAEEDDRGAPTVFENRRPSDMYYRPNAGENSVLDSRYGNHYTDGRERMSVPEPEARGVVTTNGNENNDTTTVLVFKDGVQREVTNYAIMGQYIFVFSGDRRKIPLTEIDLDATKKLNEDRGNEFKIPSSSQTS